MMFVAKFGTDHFDRFLWVDQLRPVMVVMVEQPGQESQMPVAFAASITRVANIAYFAMAVTMVEQPGQNPQMPMAFAASITRVADIAYFAMVVMMEDPRQQPSVKMPFTADLTLVVATIAVVGQSR